MGRTGAVAAGSPLSRGADDLPQGRQRPYVPVWFRWAGDAFEVVIAKGDVKLRHLARDPRCVLLSLRLSGRFVAWRRAGWRR